MVFLSVFCDSKYLLYNFFFDIMEVDIYNDKRAIEGNVYLGRIVKKIHLANDKFGFMVYMERVPPPVKL